MNKRDRDRCISSYLSREDAESYARRTTVVYENQGILDMLNAPLGGGATNKLS